MRVCVVVCVRLCLAHESLLRTSAQTARASLDAHFSFAVMALSRVGTGRRAPLDLSRIIVEFRSDGPKVSVEKFIAAVEKANLVEARHFEKVFATGVDKVVAVILESPMGAEGATVTVVEDFVRHLPRLAELEAKLRGHHVASSRGLLGSCGQNHHGDVRKPLFAQQVQVGDKRKTRQSTGRGGKAADEVGLSSRGHFADGRGLCRRWSHGFRRSGASTVRPGDDPDESEGMGGHVKMARVAVWPCVASGRHRNHGVHP